MKDIQAGTVDYEDVGFGFAVKTQHTLAKTERTASTRRRPVDAPNLGHSANGVASLGFRDNQLTIPGYRFSEVCPFSLILSRVFANLRFVLVTLLALGQTMERHWLLDPPRCRF